MKVFIARLAVVWAFLALAMPSSFAVLQAQAAQASVTSELQTRLREATFEVVMRKPEHDSLRYERPLPLELLSYSERTDKYRSIGTAFAIGPNTYVSASHVLEAGMLTQFGEPALRDASGAVHEIDQILKYSNEADFVVFSLKVPFKGRPLDVNRNPAVNDSVLAVGNALGEGIVARDGLLTSFTPEQVDGRWKWLRFSAAASPGNSGGPLLDAQGRVLGLVLRKSESENLNYAGPISLVLDAPANVARIGGYFGYQLPVLEATEGEKISHEIKLPLSFSAFAKQIVAYRTALGDHHLAQLLAKNADNIFPRGPGSIRLLNGTEAASGLNLIMRKPDGSWESFGASRGANALLDHNGFVTIGGLAGMMVTKIRKPDDVDAKTFYANSTLYMDYMLKALPLRRQIGAQQIRITSLGPAITSTMYTDDYGRKWQVREWRAEFEDIVVVSYALAVPEGYVALLRAVTTAGGADIHRDLRHMANFVDVSYNGTLEQWQGFLQQKPLLPAAFNAIDISYDYGKHFSYRSQRFALAFDESLQSIRKDSALNLNFEYFVDKGAVHWDAIGLGVVEKKEGGQSLYVTRHAKPDSMIPDSEQIQWRKMGRRSYPFDGSVIDSAGDVYVRTIYPTATNGGALAPGVTPTETQLDALRVLYEVNYSNLGKHPAAEVQATVAKWLKAVQVLE